MIIGLFNFIKYTILKMCYIVLEAREKMIKEHEALDEYYSEVKCPTCHGIPDEHFVCKTCRL